MSAPIPGSAAALLLAAAGTATETATAGMQWRDAAVLHALETAWARGDLDAVTTLATGYDTLLLGVPDRPAAGAGQLVLRSVGNAERRNRGAFSTPPEYAAALAERAIPALTEWAGPAGLTELGPGRAPTVVDPACGAGALLRAALARLLELGLAAAQARPALHGVDADPVAVQLCRAVLAADLTRAGNPCAPADLADQIVVGDALMGATPACPAGGPDALAWHLAFPHVLAQNDALPEPVTGWRGGFDVVVANPPWERLKVLARDWGGAPPEGLRSHRAGHARGLRDAGRHPLTGTGELNAYLPFVETCWRLLAPRGRAAILVPAGIASDRSSAPLLETVARAGSLDRLHLIDPVAPIFIGVSARVSVAIVELAGGPARSPGTTPVDPQVRVAVGLTGPRRAGPELERAEWSISATQLRALNPNTGATPLFASATDARIVTRAHRRTPVLVRRDPQSGRVVDDAWSLRLITPLHMTRDAVHFRSEPGAGLLPLWEAKNCSLLDPLGGSAGAHRYWVPEDLVHERFGKLTERGWLAGYRNVSTSVAPRTLIPSPLPIAGVGNSLPLLSAPELPLLMAALSTLPVDYLLRQKHAGANVNFFKLEQVPVPAPSQYLQRAPWAPGTTIGQWVLDRFAQAVVWRPGLAALAAELTARGVTLPARARLTGGLTDDEVADDGVADDGSLDDDRLTARAELDAVHALLLGLSIGDLTHALSTFTALRLREERSQGRFVTADRVLAAFHRLSPPG